MALTDIKILLRKKGRTGVPSSSYSSGNGDQFSAISSEINSLTAYLEGLQSLLIPVASDGRELSYSEASLAVGLKSRLDFWSEGNSAALGSVSAESGGAGSDGGSGTSGSAYYDRLDSWGDYTADKSGWVLSALLGVDLHTRLNTHINDTTLHITASERLKWDKAATDLSSIIGTDADSIINKWDEIVKFLSNYTEADTLASLLSGKVDKVAGYGLSKNDFTDALLAKLNGIEAGANKYVLPTASASVKGGVKVGNGLQISSEVLSVNLSVSDIPSLPWSKITSKPTTLAGYGITDLLFRNYRKDGYNSVDFDSLGDNNDMNGVFAVHAGYNNYLSTLPFKFGGVLNLSCLTASAQIAYTQSGLFYRGLWWSGNNVSWGDWLAILTSSNFATYLDTRYYTKTESDARFVNVTGDTMTGSLNLRTSKDVNINVTDGVTPDAAYGLINVARNASGDDLAYFGLVRSGKHARSIGLDVNGNIIFGQGNASNNKYISSIFATIRRGGIDVPESIKVGDALISWDSDRQALKISTSVYSDGEVAALGASTTSGSASGSGSAYYDVLSAWSDYTSDKAGWILSAALGWDLNTRIKANASDIATLKTSVGTNASEIAGLQMDVASLKSGAAVSVTTTGSGNAITSLTKSGTTITATKGATFLTSHQTLDHIKSIQLSSESLANLVATDTRSYFASGSNSVTDKPASVDAFGMLCLKTAGGWTGQILISSNSNTNIYWRTASTLNGAWRTLLDSSNYKSVLDSVYQAKGNYVDLTSAQTITGIKSFTNGLRLNTASSWTNGDRAIPFSRYDDNSVLQYYYSDADKGLTFNAATGALKSGSFVKRGGTASQFLKADGSVDSNTYLTTGAAASTYLARSGGSMLNTNLVTNLNADLLDGYHESSFMRFRGNATEDGEETLWGQIGIKQYDNRAPDDLVGKYKYGGVISLSGGGVRLEMYVSHHSSDWATTQGGLAFRSGWYDYKEKWSTILDDNNYGVYLNSVYLGINANAVSATKLADNTSYTAWGQTFFTNGKPRNASGNIFISDYCYIGTDNVGTGFSINRHENTQWKACWFAINTDGDVTINKKLLTIGAVTLNSTLSVNGATTLNSTATVKGLLTASAGIKIGDALISWDSDRQALKISTSVYSDGEVAALGASTTSGSASGSGSAYYDVLSAWSDYTSDKAGWILSASLGWDLNTRIKANASDIATLKTSVGTNASEIAGLQTDVASLKSGAAVSVTTTGSGNAITSLTKSGTTITATKGATFLTSHQTLDHINYLGEPDALTGTTPPPDAGLRFYGAYNNGYPTSYGNILRLRGIGHGELLLGWTGDSTPTLGRVYYRSKRDVNSVEWSDWGTLAYLTDLSWDKITGKPTNFVTTDTNQVITGQKIFNTQNETKPFMITRVGVLGESLRIGINDNITTFHYLNDEYASYLKFTLENTDQENSDGSRASSHTLSLFANNTGFRMDMPGVIHADSFVRNGGTANQFLMADGSVANKYNNTTTGNLGWSNQTTASSQILTANTLAYWNGKYNGSSSNLAYCIHGAFGAIATKGIEDYVKTTGQPFSSHLQGSWLKIISFQITSGAFNPSLSFTWYPTECQRGRWLDFNINIRQNDILFYKVLNGSTDVNAKCIGDGVNFEIWIEINNNAYDGYGSLVIKNKVDIQNLVYNSPARQDDEPTNTYEKFAELSGLVKQATRLQTTGTYTAWGQTFFKDGVPASVSGNMANVGSITMNGYLTGVKSIELIHSTPFIDFHFDNSTADYTSRIIEDKLNRLNINAAIYAMHNGYVGIHNGSPVCALDVLGNQRIASSVSGSGGDVYLELWRGTNASWKLLNTGGILKFQSNYISSAGNYFDCLTINYNTGNTYIKGNLGIGVTPQYKLDVNGTARISGILTAVSNVNLQNELFFTETSGSKVYPYLSPADGALNLAFHKGGTWQSTSVIFEPNLTTLYGTNGLDGQLKIGNIIIDYDRLTNALRINGDVYATGEMSSLGAVLQGGSGVNTETFVGRLSDGFEYDDDVDGIVSFGDIATTLRAYSGLSPLGDWDIYFDLGDLDFSSGIQRTVNGRQYTDYGKAALVACSLIAPEVYTHKTKIAALEKKVATLENRIAQLENK